MDGFSKKNESLFRADTASLDEDEVVLDLTVVGETTKRSDVLLSDIGISGSVVLGSTSLALSDSVDSLVSFGSVEISGLTGSGDTPGNSSGMPSSDTSDFSVTSVRLLLEMSNTPSLHDTGESFTLGDTNNINELSVIEDVVDSDLLLEEVVNKSDLISDGLSTVDLDFEDVVLLLSDVVEEVLLGVDNSTNAGCVLSDSVQLDLNFLGVLGLSLIAREGFLL